MNTITKFFFSISLHTVDINIKYIHTILSFRQQNDKKKIYFQQNTLFSLNLFFNQRFLTELEQM